MLHVCDEHHVHTQQYVVQSVRNLVKRFVKQWNLFCVRDRTAIVENSGFVVKPIVGHRARFVNAHVHESVTDIVPRIKKLVQKMVVP